MKNAYCSRTDWDEKENEDMVRVLHTSQMGIIKTFMPTRCNLLSLLKLLQALRLPGCNGTQESCPVIPRPALIFIPAAWSPHDQQSWPPALCPEGNSPKNITFTFCSPILAASAPQVFPPSLFLPGHLNINPSVSFGALSSKSQMRG